ncbi:hypothetical protein CMMCA002_03725 [Clavibacter michiganensis subsp. michiganensis]|nr:hypothetical protein CMMCA002_03725 [Clavibacter michiganensis subsp. michiganensis]
MSESTRGPGYPTSACSSSSTNLSNSPPDWGGYATKAFPLPPRGVYLEFMTRCIRRSASTLKGTPRSAQTPAAARATGSKASGVADTWTFQPEAGSSVPSGVRDSQMPSDREIHPPRATIEATIVAIPSGCRQCAGDR